MKMVMFQKIVDYAKLTYVCLLGSLATTLFGLSPQIDGVHIILVKFADEKPSANSFLSFD